MKKWIALLGIPVVVLVTYYATISRNIEKHIFEIKPLVGDVKEMGEVEIYSTIKDIFTSTTYKTTKEGVEKTTKDDLAQTSEDIGDKYPAIMGITPTYFSDSQAFSTVVDTVYEGKHSEKVFLKVVFLNKETGKKYEYKEELVSAKDYSILDSVQNEGLLYVFVNNKVDAKSRLDCLVFNLQTGKKETMIKGDIGVSGDEYKPNTFIQVKNPKMDSLYIPYIVRTGDDREEIKGIRFHFKTKKFSLVDIINDKKGTFSNTIKQDEKYVYMHYFNGEEESVALVNKETGKVKEQILRNTKFITLIADVKYVNGKWYILSNDSEENRGTVTLYIYDEKTTKLLFKGEITGNISGISNYHL